MSYIPKSLVNNNLYTAGEEFTDLNGNGYSGSYHEQYDGSIFSGPNSYYPNKQLLSIKQTNTEPTKVPAISENIFYSNLNPTNTELYKYGLDPEPYFPLLTNQDYKRGNIIRYFARRANQKPNQIIEITPEAYDDIIKQSGTYNYALWRVTNMLWKITGPLYDSKDKNSILKAGIIDTNIRLREIANQNLKGLNQYLSNLIQFSIKPDLELISNQITSGNEFTVQQDNSDYIGPYHIMADGTIMGGPTHNQSANKIFLTSNVLVQNRINTLVKEELGKLGAA
jgi:hypothetical protein